MDMFTFTRKPISLPTINEVKGYKKTDDLIMFLYEQDLELKDKHFTFLQNQELTGQCFLKLNIDTLMQDSLKRGPAEEIAEFINKIKGEKQGKVNELLKDSSYLPRSKEDEEICLDDYEMIKDYYVPYTTLVQANWYTNKNSQEKFWRDVKNRMGDIKFHFMKCSRDSKMTELVKKYLVKKKHIKQKGSVKYLFAFDEACTLVGKKVKSKNIEKNSLFYYIRHALIHLPKKAGIFAVFTDTYSNISNFSPASYLDPSKRVAEAGSQLFGYFIC
ncbi:9600_t:CDS:2 [Cetraspora pellucida]|uniref:9600_t:CDS:1 n=1 Tax=Cetraspora pellucida TaxID=1433469 RepID=A0A9N9JQE4_9GLOM|nr:9600_t:CDS:2 [Cetraspora pellucida]